MIPGAKQGCKELGKRDLQSDFELFLFYTDVSVDSNSFFLLYTGTSADHVFGLFSLYTDASAESDFWA